MDSRKVPPVTQPPMLTGVAVGVPPALTVAFGPAWKMLNCVAEGIAVTKPDRLKLVSPTPAMKTLPPRRYPCASEVVKVATPPLRTAPMMVRGLAVLVS